MTPLVIAITLGSLGLWAILMLLVIWVPILAVWIDSKLSARAP